MADTLAAESSLGGGYMSGELPARRGFFENPAIPPAFKTIVFFGVPLLVLGGLVAAVWLLSYRTDVLSAAYTVIVGLPLAGAVITFAIGKIDLKTFLIVALVFGFPFLPVIVGGVVWLIRGY